MRCSVLRRPLRAGWGREALHMPRRDSSATIAFANICRPPVANPHARLFPRTTPTRRRKSRHVAAALGQRAELGGLHASGGRRDSPIGGSRACTAEVGVCIGLGVGHATLRGWVNESGRRRSTTRHIKARQRHGGCRLKDYDDAALMQL